MKNKVTEIFSQIRDPRVVERCDHKLVDILFIAFCTLLSNGEDFEDMVEFAHQRQDWLRTVIELPNGIPSHDTFNRVLQMIDSAALSKCLQSDGAGLLESIQGQLVNLDGKKIKGVSPKSRGNKGLWILSAWVSNKQLCIGQKKVDDKSNEITAIPELIDELNLAGSIVSIDAIGCQIEIAQKIRSSKADYLLAVKDNQADLLEEVQEAFQHSPMEDFEENWEYDHGRYEERRCEILDASLALSPGILEKWADIRKLVKIEAKRQVKGNTSTETRYYISSLEAHKAAQFNEMVRGHWSIENQLHWHLDVTFREDDSRARKGNAPMNLNILRKMALARIKQMDDKLSLKKRRFRAALNNEYLLKVLGESF